MWHGHIIVFFSENKSKPETNELKWPDVKLRLSTFILINEYHDSNNLPVTPHIIVQWLDTFPSISSSDWLYPCLLYNHCQSLAGQEIPAPEQTGEWKIKAQLVQGLKCDKYCNQLMNYAWFTEIIPHQWTMKTSYMYRVCQWTIYLKVVITVCDDKRKALHTYTKCLVLYME